jgi:hypothetical protein
MPPSRKQPQRRNAAKSQSKPSLQVNPFPAPRQSAELKCCFLGTNDQQLYHNIPVAMFNAMSCLDVIASGTSITQRVGDAITVRRLSIKALVNSKADRPNVTYRVIGVLAPYSELNDTFAEMFFSSGATPNITAPQIPGRTLLLFDRYLSPSQYSVTPLTSGGTQKERTHTFSYDHDLNRDVHYVSGVCTTRFMVWVVAYDAYGTLTTDNIASLPTASLGVYYTDS